MIFTLGLHKLPFEPDCRQIIYIGGEKDKEVTELIERHFHRIRDHFQSRGYTFCYIPYVKHDLLSGDRLHYNAPFAKSSREADYMVSDNFILDYMVHPENRDKVTPSLLYYTPEYSVDEYTDAEDQMQGITLSEASFVDNPDLGTVLEEILADIREKSRTTIMFDLQLPPDEYEYADYRRRGDWLEKTSSAMVAEPEEDGLSCRNVSYRDYRTADEQFDVESRRLVKEIEERINKLCQKGIDAYLIEQMSKNRMKLSRMHIDKNYRIYLGDYMGMEISLTPLNKAVYFLFLRHPEGIRFKELSDHRQELMDIYSRLKSSFGSEASLQSIENLVNPFDNSINEKCARIREAFVSQFDEHMAQYYFITGQRGEPKGIKLPRKYVRWDAEIRDLFE